LRPHTCRYIFLVCTCQTGLYLCTKSWSVPVHIVLSNLQADFKQPANLDFSFLSDAQAAGSDVEAGDGETKAAERPGASAASSDSVRLQILQPLKRCVAAAATKAGTAVDVAFARSNGDAPAIEAVWLPAGGPASASMAADPATAAAAAAPAAYPGAVPQRPTAPEAPVPTASEVSEAAPSAAEAPAALHPGASCCGGKAARSAAPRPCGDGAGRPGALPPPAGAASDAAEAAAPASVPAVEAAAPGAAPGCAAPRDAAVLEEAAQQSAEAAAQPRPAPCCHSVSLDLERSTSTVWVSAPSMELSDCLRPGSAAVFAARTSSGGRDGGGEGVAPSACGDGGGAGPAAGAVEVAADYTDAAAAAEPTGSGNAASSGTGSDGCSSGGTPWYKLAAILLQGWVS